jgi:putative ABC transport system permease protein
MLFAIAWRNIWRHKVRSLAIITSVVIGLWIGAFVNAMYWGMSEDRVKIAIENEISHIQIHHPKFKEDYKAEFAIPMNDELVSVLQQNENVKAYSLRTIAQAMLATAGGSTGLQVNGIHPQQEQNVTGIYNSIIEGEYLTEEKRNAIMVGDKLAKKMKLKLKSKVVLTYLDKENNIISGAFRVSGIFKTQNTTWDERNVFVRMEDLAPSMLLHNEIHEIAILLHSNSDVESTAEFLQNKLPALQVQDWMKVSPETGLIISTMTQFSIVFIIIILLALSFGIINTMLMAILERMREIGMMMALGMNKLKIFLLVLFETCLLVFIGCPIGLFVAWISIKYFSVHGIDISSFAEKAMSSYGFGTMIYPMLPNELYVQIIILVIITALVSSVFPAVKALKLNPAEAIKS